MLFIALLLATVAGFVIVPSGTDLPIHWGLSGTPDMFAPREVALLFPFIIAAIVTLVLALAFRHGFRAEHGRHLNRAVLPGMIAIFLVIEICLVLTGVGIEVDTVRILVFALAVLLMVMGNALPKTQANGVAGIASLAAGLLLIGLAATTGATPLLLSGVLAAYILPLLAGGVVGWRVSQTS